jgi:hypothetical protein
MSNIWQSIIFSIEIDAATGFAAGNRFERSAEGMRVAGYGDVVGLKKLADSIMSMVFLICQLWVSVNLLIWLGR